MTLILAQNDVQADFILFVFIVLIVLLGLIGYFAYSLWKSREVSSPSPYTGLPLRRARELTFTSKDIIQRFLYNLHDYDNQIIDFNKAALCRETGRIFPNVVTWTDSISVDWNFLQKRYPGNYVSWGSLSEELKQEIRNSHLSLDHFQVENSSSNPSPRIIEPEELALKKPGPLYVDVDTKVLLGWQCVPGTEFEVLIVQKPKKVSLIHIEKTS